MRVLYVVASGKILAAVRDADWPTFVSPFNVAFSTMYIDEIIANRSDLRTLVQSLKAPITLPTGSVIQPQPWTVSGGGTTLTRSDSSTWTPAVDTDRTNVSTTTPDELYRLIRAEAEVLLDEFNNLRQWLASFKTETAAASSLANFQSRVAGLPNTPDRTLSQLKTAIENKL
jgi:hypothetical protein